MVLQGFTYQKDSGSHTFQSLRVPAFESLSFFRGLNSLRVVVLKVSGLEGWRVLGFQGSRVAGLYIPKRFRLSIIFVPEMLPSIDTIKRYGFCFFWGKGR